MADTETILSRKDTSACYGCGESNALGLRVPFSKLGENGSTALYTARREHAGWADVLHGGVTFSLMDEACGWSLFFQNIPAVTARVETRFHKPIHVGTEVVISAWVVRQRRTLYDVHAEIRSRAAPSMLLAEADAVMFEVTK